MTNGKVINVLKNYTLGKMNTDKVEISVLKLNRIIKALEQESTTKNDLTDNKTFYEQIVEYCNEHFLVLVEKDVWEDARKALTTKNDLALIHTEGLEEEIRCTMCTNRMKSDRGCDGSCVVNNAMYKNVMDAIEKRIQPTTKNDLGVDCISRKAVQTRLKEIINEMETIFADIREKEVDDSVCGLCEYDCDHGLDGFANECPGFEKDDCFKLNEKYRAEWLDISNLPSVTPQEPRKGHWILTDVEGNNVWHCHCSECGKDPQDYVGGSENWWLIKSKLPEFCPSCGSDNREVVEE